MRASFRFSLFVLILSLSFSAPAASETDETRWTLRLRVLSDDGEPIADALVRAVDLALLEGPRQDPPRPVWIGRAKTDAEGRATLRYPDTREIVLWILPAGRANPHVTEVLRPGDERERDLGEIRLPRPGELSVELEVSPSVRAHIAAGRIEGFRIFATPGQRGGRLIRETSEDANVSLPGVPPGKWTLSAAILAGDRVLRFPETIEIDLEPGATARASFEIDALLYLGAVRLRGAPVDGVLLVASPDGEWRARVPLDDEGRFAVALPAAGTYDLLAVSSEPFFRAAVLGARFREEDANGEIEIRLPEGRIQGRVIDAAGGGVEGARVVAELNAGAERAPLMAFAVSGPDGAFTIDVLPGGRWSVGAIAETASSDSRPAIVPPDLPADEITLRLSHPKREARFVTPAGEPVEGAIVVATAQHQSPVLALAHGRTDAEGRVRLDPRIPNAAAVAIAVRPETGGIFTFFRRPEEEGPLELSSADLTLRLLWPARWRNTDVLVHEDGSFLALGDWVALSGANLNEPLSLRIRSGRWKLVNVLRPELWRELYRGAGFSLPAFREIEAEPGASVDLK